MNIVANAEAETNRIIFDAFKDVGVAKTAKLGCSRHIVVAEDVDEAERLITTAFAYWRASLAKLWRDNGADLIRFPKDFDEAKVRGLAIGGTPAMIRDELASQMDASGTNYILYLFAFGNLADEVARQSLDLFIDQVALAPFLEPLLSSQEPQSGA